MDNKSILITGSNGQLGSALRQQYPNARFVDRDELDISNPDVVDGYDWQGVKVIINAAAYTNVDGAETLDGRVAAWQVNAGAVSNLVRAAMQNDLLLIHVSTDYVFDGTKAPHKEDEPLSPLSVYGHSKAAGDLLVSLLPKHYLLRTSWVIGEGKNFVRTMLDLGAKGVNPTVVSDQTGRLTFTSELVRAIDHLLQSRPEYGTYNLSNGGDIASWADITRQIFKESGYNLTVADTTTSDYYQGKDGIAPRPLQSAFDLSKIQATGFEPKDWREDLHNYIAKELQS